MLVIVKDRDVKTGTKALFNFKTLGCLDVFKVDSTKCRSDALHEVNNFIGSTGINTNRETVNSTELLEKKCFTFHDRHCAFGTNVTETKHCGSVADDGDGVLANGVFVRQAWIILNRRAHTSNTRCIRH